MIRNGWLTVAYDGRRPEIYGDGSGAEVAVRLSTRGARRIGLKPGLGLGEAYMDGDLVLERGSLWNLLQLVGQNYPSRPRAGKSLPRDILKAAKKAVQQSNNAAAARRNVAHHYDLSNDLYRRFLDTDMQYSCAYFARPDMTLEEAQAAKKAHIAAKLNLSPGQRVLDIGCGWGGLGLDLARTQKSQVTGVTLSTEQLSVARARAEAEGLADVARFELADYRSVTGTFDRIVSVGMFEHVGAPNYGAFFKTIARLLDEDGVAVIHSIGRLKGPGITNAFTQKYIFPGAYVPALSEVMPAVERAGLLVADVEILRLHYAETLRCWRERFAAQRDAVADLYDERFCRMWEYYLASAELGFRYGGHMVFQLQLTKRIDALPITRDYVGDGERALLDRARHTGMRSVA